MIEAIALLVFAGIIALCMLILVIDWARRRFIAWRDARDLRIRDARHRGELLKSYEPHARVKRL